MAAEGIQEGIDELVPVGYSACGCGDYLAIGSLQANRGRCDACQKRWHHELTEARLRFEVKGRTFESKPKASRARKRPNKPRPPTAANRAYSRARTRALVRLAQIYGPTFELLFAEEKAKVGVDPRIRPNAAHPIAIEEALLADIAEAEAREERATEARQLRGA